MAGGVFPCQRKAETGQNAVALGLNDMAGMAGDDSLALLLREQQSLGQIVPSRSLETILNFQDGVHTPSAQIVDNFP